MVLYLGYTRSGGRRWDSSSRRQMARDGDINLFKSVF